MAHHHRASSQELGSTDHRGEAGGNASFCRSLLTSPLGVEAAAHGRCAAGRQKATPRGPSALDRSFAEDRQPHLGRSDPQSMIRKKCVAIFPSRQTPERVCAEIMRKQRGAMTIQFNPIALQESSGNRPSLPCARSRRGRSQWARSAAASYALCRKTSSAASGCALVRTAS